MSNQRNNNASGIAGMATAAVGIAALGFAAYKWYQANNENNQERPLAVGSSSSGFVAERKCRLCKKDFETSDSLKLTTCGHTFHKKCIKDNYTQHEDDLFGFSCPVCEWRVAQDDIALIKRIPKKCPVCDKEITATNSYKLMNCSHIFHKNCIQANYILHMGEEVFKCPISQCQRRVGPQDVNGILQLNQSSF